MRALLWACASLLGVCACLCLLAATAAREWILAAPAPESLSFDAAYYPRPTTSSAQCRLVGIYYMCF